MKIETEFKSNSKLNLFDFPSLFKFSQTTKLVNQPTPDPKEPPSKYKLSHASLLTSEDVHTAIKLNQDYHLNISTLESLSEMHRHINTIPENLKSRTNSFDKLFNANKVKINTNIQKNKSDE